MEPIEVKRRINGEYERLKDHQNVFNLIKSLAVAGARHNGIPEYWKEYMPKELMRKGG